MTELPRLRDEAESTVELLLLEAGASYRSSADTRAKTLAALGLAGSAAVSAGALSAAGSSVVGSSVLGKVTWAKLLLITGIGAGVAAPVAYGAWNRFHSPSPTISAPVAPPASPAPVMPEKAPVVAAPAVQIPAEPPVVLPKAEAKPASTSALAAELVALDAARGKLAAGDASGAIGKLDEYSRAYPHGHLVLEAEVLRIDALAKSGQSELAKKRAEAFLRRHPNSVLASRVRGYLD